MIFHRGYWPPINLYVYPALSSLAVKTIRKHCRVLCVCGARKRAHIDVMQRIFSRAFAIAFSRAQP